MSQVESMARTIVALKAERDRLADALGKIEEQASRRKRGTTEQEYLLRDLEFIEERARAALAPTEHAP